jgi:hypothetical protein
MTNPILESLRETRERLLAESGGTLDGLVARLQAEERRSGRAIWQPVKRPPQSPPAPEAPAAR